MLGREDSSTPNKRRITNCDLLVETLVRQFEPTFFSCLPNEVESGDRLQDDFARQNRASFISSPNAKTLSLVTALLISVHDVAIYPCPSQVFER